MSKRSRDCLSSTKKHPSSPRFLVVGKNGTPQAKMAAKNRAKKNLNKALNSQSKATNNDSNWADEVETEEEQMPAYMRSLMANVKANGSKMDEVLRKTNAMEKRLKTCEEKTTSCPQVKKDVDKLKDLQKQLEGKTESIRRMMLDQEFRSRQLNIMVKGVRIHPEAVQYKETTEQTQEMMGNILHLIRPPSATAAATLNVRVHRFATKPRVLKSVTERGDALCPIIKLTCASIQDKEALYTSLAEKVADTQCDPQIRQLQFQTDYPNGMVKEVNRLDELGWKIRKESGKQIKTRIECKQGELLLLVRDPGELHYKPYDADKRPLLGKQQQPQTRQQKQQQQPTVAQPMSSQSTSQSNTQTNMTH